MPPADISVCITCHNEADFVKEAVNSVVAQSVYDKVAEIIVVDDASTDGSAIVLTELAHRIPKLRIVKGKGRGPGAARNLAVRRSQGELIAFLDGDDAWTEMKLARQCAAIADPDIGVVYCDILHHVGQDHSQPVPVLLRDPPAELSGQELALRWFVRDPGIMPSTMLLRRRAWEMVGGFRETLKTYEDSDFCLRLALGGWRFRRVAEPLVWKRLHPGHIGGIDARMRDLEPQARAFAREFPAAAPLLSARLSERLARLAWMALEAEDRGRATELLAAAWRHRPLNPTIYRFLMLAAIRRFAGSRRLDQLKAAWRRRAARRSSVS